MVAYQLYLSGGNAPDYPEFLPFRARSFQACDSLPPSLAREPASSSIGPKPSEVLLGSPPPPLCFPLLAKRPRHVQSMSPLPDNHSTHDDDDVCIFLFRGWFFFSIRARGRANGRARRATHNVLFCASQRESNTAPRPVFAANLTTRQIGPTTTIRSDPMHSIAVPSGGRIDPPDEWKTRSPVLKLR